MDGSSEEQRWNGSWVGGSEVRRKGGRKGGSGSWVGGSEGGRQVGRDESTEGRRAGGGREKFKGRIDR
eukprot:120714-Pleurochrysis_carterae.AAC.1